MKYTEEQYFEISNNMIKYGGGFIKFIGQALARADTCNRIKLEKAFPEYFEEYLSN